MNTFEKYINKTENQDLKNFTKYLDDHELAMLEMHFLSFAKEQLRIHDVVGRSEQLCQHDRSVTNRICDDCGSVITYVPDDELV